MSSFADMEEPDLTFEMEDGSYLEAFEVRLADILSGRRNKIAWQKAESAARPACDTGSTAEAFVTGGSRPS